MKIKIISKKQYDELIKLLKEAYVIVTSLEAENKRLKELQAENVKLKVLLHRNGISYLSTNIDFPATEKLHEDKNY